MQGNVRSKVPSQQHTVRNSRGSTDPAASSHKFFPPPCSLSSLFQMDKEPAEVADSPEVAAATKAWAEWQSRYDAERRRKQKRREWEKAHASYDNVIIMGPLEPLQYVWRWEWEQELIR